MTEAKQTPLPDLLDRVPDDIVLGIPGDEPVFPSYTNIPIGKLARQAAAELRRQHGEIKSMRTERLRSERRLSAVEAQRDALLEALKYHQEQTRPIQRTLDVIKAVEEGK